ncbi:hypothetical protein EDB81DRAFT_932667 [Dactylonectria macrodidyma]|uniref:Uncharacterized protein n=1 Tax=Dactylonectria macrodidyma TaxID=307937 RepID=A0A9P9EZH2_9HYPO|nr:hypothetical protein EDB81DRAFT_932667 [Dactylonectria macrodidyma]
MCQEIIALAICAPSKTPHMSFTCGKLHMVAGERIVCKDARGTCVCFFGTCGKVDREVTTMATDLADLTKVRCASCTKREDDTGDRRHGEEIINSPLLQRPAIPGGEDVHRQFQATLKNLWGGKPSCPFHAPPETAASSTDEVNEPTPSVASDESKATIATDSTQSKSTISQPAITNGLVTGVGLQSSRWANAPPAPPPTTRPVRPRPLAQTPTTPAPAARTPTVRDPTANATPKGNFNAKARVATRKIFNAKAFLSNDA